MNTERILAEARYFVEHSSTIRDTAKYFGVSKSNLHKDLRIRLLELDQLELYNKVIDHLNFNKKVRHYRGGIATAKKYKLKSKKCTK